jgi:hypothetical protein
MPARIGDRSKALRMVSERMENGRYTIRLQGRSGMTYTLGVRAPGASLPSLSVLPAVTDAAAFDVRGADDKGFARVHVTIPDAQVDADGYAEVTLVFTSKG